MSDTNEYQPRTAARIVEILRSQGVNPRSLQAEAAGKIEQFRDALSHMQWCVSCAKDGWERCEEGVKAKALLAEMPG